MTFNLLKIKELLTRQKMTVKEFSAQIGKAQRTTENYLAGNSKIDVYTLENIAKVLGVPVGYFFGESSGGVTNGSGILQNGNGNKASINNLHKEVEYLKQQIIDKNEIINLLKEKK